MYDTLDTISYAVFPGLAGFAVVIIIIVTGITGRIHDKSWTMISVDYIRLINSSGLPATQSERIERRVIALRLLAYPSLKVWIGNLYFLKISTKLTLLALMVNSTVYFLLTV